MNVCQKCGDAGYTMDLVYCVHCEVSAEHRYCLDILPKSKNEKVVWTCEECAAKETKLSPVISRKSERISQAAEVRLSRKQMRKQNSFPCNKACVRMDSFPEAKQSRGDCLLSNDDSKKLPAIVATVGNQELSATFDNQELRKQRRRLLVEDGDNSDEESETVKTETSPLVSTVSDGPLNTSKGYLLFSESDKYSYSQPMNDPIWRGFFNINNVKHQTSVGLVAHLTRKGCSKACDAVTVLPLLCSVEILSKSAVWPQRFQTSPPNGDSIVLYFFPEYESDEKVFDALLDDMIDHNLALKAVIKDVELLVFSSLELPPDHWRICRKYYMWGVLEPTNHLG
ncbi:hypothetical protein ACOSQ3_022628 [Xanthoceras sorbifolium]